MKKTIFIFLLWNFISLSLHTVSQIRLARAYAELDPVVAEMNAAGFDCATDLNGSLECANAQGTTINFDQLLQISKK